MSNGVFYLLLGAGIVAAYTDLFIRAGVAL